MHLKTDLRRICLQVSGEKSPIVECMGYDTLHLLPMSIPAGRQKTTLEQGTLRNAAIRHFDQERAALAKDLVASLEAL